MFIFAFGDAGSYASNQKNFQELICMISSGLCECPIHLLVDLWIIVCVSDNIKIFLKFSLEIELQR